MCKSSPNQNMGRNKSGREQICCLMVFKWPQPAAFDSLRQSVFPRANTYYHSDHHQYHHDNHNSNHHHKQPNRLNVGPGPKSRCPTPSATCSLSHATWIGCDGDSDDYLFYDVGENGDDNDDGEEEDMDVLEP